MFSFSCKKLFTDYNLKLLCNEYRILNKYLHACNRKATRSGKVVLKEVKPSLFNNYKIISNKQCDESLSIRYFSSKLGSNLKEETIDKTSEEKSGTGEISSEEESSSTSDDENLDFYKVDEEAITNGDPDLLKKLKLCMLEIETFKEQGFNVPSHLKTDEWKELINFRSRSAKLKYLRYLFLNEHHRRNNKIKKERKRLKRLEELEKLNENMNKDHIRYGLCHNTIFLRVSETTMNVLGNNRLVRAMKFGQDLVIDCSYDNYMTKKEMNYCAKQLTYVFAHNRNNDDPFNIHFTGINPDSQLIHQFKKYIPTLFDWDFPLNITEKSYLELFPKERLVYLTPHCRNDMKTFSHDDIYIIGGLVDKQNCHPLSLAKAKSEGLRMARFPLDEYLSWVMGSKSLTLDQCLNILLDLKKTGNWEKALVHVPRRKLSPGENVSFEEDEEKEDIKDKSMQFGQSYVVPHEWGLNKGQKSWRRKQVVNLDLRTIVARAKKGNKDSQ